MLQVTPGIERNPFTTWSRSSIYSRRICSTHSCGPFRAATAAFCTIEVGFDVDWLCSLAIALTTADGAIAYPSLHPVMAYVFESEPSTTKRSLYSRRAPTEKFLPV